MAGRNPKPTALKLLQGNPGRRPINQSEPRPDAGTPDMPEGLSDAAEAEWQRILPILAKMRVLTVADSSTIAGYCQSRADWLEAQAEIALYGITVAEPIVSRAGDVLGERRKKNPAVTVASDAKKMMRAFASDLGLSPASRTRVHSQPEDAKPGQDDVDDLLDEVDPDEKPS
jgi:P27 family predicted phage terminase small subunit